MKAEGLLKSSFLVSSLIPDQYCFLSHLQPIFHFDVVLLKYFSNVNNFRPSPPSTPMTRNLRFSVSPTIWSQFDISVSMSLTW